jgi:hypothetical protein
VAAAQNLGLDYIVVAAHSPSPDQLGDTLDLGYKQVDRPIVAATAGVGAVDMTAADLQVVDLQAVDLKCVVAKPLLPTGGEVEPYVAQRLAEVAELVDALQEAALRAVGRVAVAQQQATQLAEFLLQQN